MATVDKAASSVPRIRKLDETVVNRIAAGEIIQRPANALKELVENSLDAGSSSIVIVVRDGGLKTLQITDNGHGIALEDLPLLCERFATSKLSVFDDLKRIATFGFRGEALASMSHVSHLRVTTKTEDSPCAWRADYFDGKLLNPRPGENPKACAGNKGTTILIEDLFYNVPTRKRALSNLSDEYSRIVEVVERYAVHYPRVSFVVRKVGSSAADIQTVSGTERRATVQAIYGNKLARELLAIEESRNDDLDYTFDAMISKLNYSSKRFHFLLFVNDRAVESNSLKARIKGLYSQYLSKGSHPFVYLSIKIPPHKIDVNMHPTKRQVAILNEDRIYEDIVDKFAKKLTEVNESRVYYTQSLISDMAPQINTYGNSQSQSRDDTQTSKKRKIDDSQDGEDEEEDGDSSLPESSQKERPNKYILSSSLSNSRKVYDNELIRVDGREQTIDKMFFRNEQANQISLSARQRQQKSQRAVEQVKSGQCSLLQMFGSASKDNNINNNTVNKEIETENNELEPAVTPATTNIVQEPAVPEPVTEEDNWETSKFQTSNNFNQLLTTFNVNNDKIGSNVSSKDNEVAGNADSTNKYATFFDAIGAPLREKEEKPPKQSTIGDANTMDLDNIENVNIEALQGGELTKGKSNAAIEEISEEERQHREAVAKYEAMEMEYENSIVFTEVKLTSVNTMADKISRDTHVPAHNIIKNHTFVGFVDDVSCIVQYETRLYILNHQKAIAEMIYQLSIRGFANFGVIKFENPGKITDMLRLALDSISDVDWETGQLLGKEEIIEQCKELLLDRKDMLKEYFSIDITDEGYITTLPVILRHYTPDFTKLPFFLLKICSEIEWDDEYLCLEGICKELSNFYKPSKRVEFEFTEKILLATLKKYWRPSYKFVEQEKGLVVISNLKNLYRVFERC